MSSKYGWTPQQIADMTPAQVAAYLGERDGLEMGPTGKPVKRLKSVEEAMKFQQQVRSKS